MNLIRVFGGALALVVAIQISFCAPRADAQSAPTDELRLHDGAFLRGTIVEQTTSELTFRLVTGEIRVYPMSEVESVGPAVVAAPAPPPAVAVPAAPTTVAAPVAPVLTGPPAIRLRVEAEQRELSLHRLTGSTSVTVSTYSNGQMSSGSAIVDQYAAICNAPCDIALPQGTFVLGVAEGSGRPQRVGSPITLDHDSQLAISYDNRGVLRGMGWLAFGLGNAGGIAMLFPALLTEPSLDVSLLVGSAVVFGVGYIVFFALAFFNDAASIEVLSPEGVRF